MSERPQVIVIGGGFGGLTAARELADEYVGITLVDRANHHLFQPLLYQVATAGLSPTDIAVPIRRVLTKQDNVRVLLSEVTAIQLDERTVELDDGTRLPFDVLVLAAGARNDYFGNEAWREHTLGLKTVDDALEIRKRVLLSFEAAEREKDEARRKRLMTFVVIGGGPTGVEVAGALSDLARTVLDEDFRAIDPSGARVLLVEMADRVLAGVFDEKLCRRAQEQLEELGVEVRLGTPVKEIDERGIRLGDERIDAATVLHHYQVNAMAPLLLTQAARHSLERSPLPGGAAVVFFGDIHVAGRPRRRYAAYALSKGAVHTMVECLALEMAPRVRVNGIAPGVVAWPDDTPPEEQAQYERRIPLGRSGTPEDAANLVRWLVLEATYLTGEMVRLDGGRWLA